MAKIIFLGTGPTKPVIRKNEKRTNSSILVDNILIDCTPMFLEQVKRENIKPENIKAILITHAHKDAIGGLGDLDKWIGREIELYAPVRVNVNRFVKKFKNIKINKIMPHKTYNILNKKIIPFRVIHYEYHPTLGKEFPTYGYRINGLAYAEDLESIPKNSVKYFEDAEIIIADGAMWFGRQIRGIIQAGRTYPSQEKAEKEIQEYWNKIKGNSKTKIILAKDGLVFEDIELSLKFQGIYLVKPHAEMIWSGDKKLIVKSKNYKNMIDKPLYYLDNEFVYGILKLKKPKLIDLNQFKQLSEKHKITESERKKWWGDKQKLYAYEFDILDNFPNPKPTKVEPGTQIFVSDVKFLAETGSGNVTGSAISAGGLQPIWIYGKRKKGGREIKIPSKEIVKLIEDIRKYDPEKVTNEQLADDWRIVSAWYSTYKETDGKGIKFSKEDIINLAKLIYDEIVSIILADWRDLEFLNQLGDFLIIKDCVSLIGSTVTQDHKPNDIDLLIRMKEPNPFLKRAIEVRLSKMFPEELRDKLHFVWGETEGPHDSFIPLYDLQLKRVRPVKVVTMIEDKSSKIQLLKPFIPMKPYGSAFYDLDKFISILA